MAKDRRNKERPTLDLENETRATRPTKTAVTVKKPSTAGTTSKKRKKKKKHSRAAVIIRCVLAVLVLAFFIFLGVLANYIYQAMFVDDVEKVPPISPTEYDVTPVENTDKVAYYLLGVMGEDETDDTVMLSVACHDKQKKTVNILQIPQSTYIKGDAWAVDTVGSVFAHPKALDWCELCRKRVYAPEINEGEVATHTVCGTEITLKKGSSVSGLVDFVNDQLSLPVDEYFLMPLEAVGVLVDSVGGVDVELGGAYTLGGKTYETGVQTLSGDAAIDYISETDGTFGGDTTRMIRQREVFGALLTRIVRLERDVVLEDVVEEVMDSSAAIRTDCSNNDMTDLLLSFSPVGTSGMTVQLLPGETTKDGDGDNVYTAHKDELLSIINGEMNPYGAAISQDDLLIPELIDSGDADTRKSTLDAFVVDQTGKLLEAQE